MKNRQHKKTSTLLSPPPPASLHYPPFTYIPSSIHHLQPSFTTSYILLSLPPHASFHHLQPSFTTSSILLSLPPLTTSSHHSPPLLSSCHHLLPPLFTISSVLLLLTPTLPVCFYHILQSRHHVTFHILFLPPSLSRFLTCCSISVFLGKSAYSVLIVDNAAEIVLPLTGVQFAPFLDFEPLLVFL